MCKANRCLLLCQMTQSKVQDEAQGEPDRRLELQNKMRNVLTEIRMDVDNGFSLTLSYSRIVIQSHHQFSLVAPGLAGPPTWTMSSSGWARQFMHPELCGGLRWWC